MTPTATYIAEENCLQEESQVEKPVELNFFTESVYTAEPSFNDEAYEKAVAAYNAHLATLRKIPCSPEPGFKDGEKYSEGVDYEIKGADEWKWCYQLKGNIFAAPIVPVSEGQPGEIEQLKAENSKMRESLNLILGVEARVGWNGEDPLLMLDKIKHYATTALK